MKGLTMFDQDEKVVYPGHGVAQINRIIERNIGGKITKFFELKFISKEMTILVPVDNVDAIGIRKISSEDDIGHMFKVFERPCKQVHAELAPNWNKRNKEYLGKIRSGKLTDMCEIYRDLKSIEKQKELSFGEKNLLHQTESLLAQEIALACDMQEDKATIQLRKLAQKQINV